MMATKEPFELALMLRAVTDQLTSSNASSRAAALRWVAMLLEKSPDAMQVCISRMACARVPICISCMRGPFDACVALCARARVPRSRAGARLDMYFPMRARVPVCISVCGAPIRLMRIRIGVL